MTFGSIILIWLMVILTMLVVFVGIPWAIMAILHKYTQKDKSCQK